ncbi:MAG: GGDEF domain-containing protein [Blautia sp.]|nr:GGDEF domain-containing protein [Blautia sp.]
MISFLLIISFLLLIATGSISTVYSNLHQNMERYKQWQKVARDLQIGSDYLTEQVRYFVITGNPIYLDNYFEEAKVTRRRDKALEGVEHLLGETKAHEALENALAESVELMDREYYAMRLAIEGYGLELSQYPEEVQNIELSAKDLASSPDEKRETARLMVWDDIYRSKKEAITANIHGSLSVMDTEMEESQALAQSAMTKTIWQQRILIGASIAAIIATILMFMKMVVWPLLKAVTYIRKDQLIPVEGSEEFRFLAKEYNAAHQTSNDQKQELAYEASHDNLTGVYNRNGYDSIRQNIDWSQCALVLFDLDQFKPVNDQYGHTMGDQVLARAAKVIQNAFRAKDFVCRIGGDEFAVIMVSVPPNSGDVIRDKVRRINDELRRPVGDIPPIHLSSGAAFGSAIPDFDVLFREADAAMYRVKARGGEGCEIVQ